MAKCIRKPRFRLIIVLGTVVGLGSAAEAAADVTIPGCDALLAWAKSVDGKKRWNPVEGNTRIWLPEALNSDAFRELFGKPAMSWTQDEALDTGNAVKACGKEASKQRSGKDAKAFYAASGALAGRLRTALRQVIQAEERAERKRQAAERSRKKAEERQAAREEQRKQREAENQRRRQEREAARQQQITDHLNRSVDMLLASPVSGGLVRILAILEATDIRDKASVDKANIEIVRIPDPANAMARGLLYTLGSMPPDTMDSEVRPRITNRLGEVRATLTADLVRQVEAVPDNAAGLRQLDMLGQRVNREVGPALGEDGLKTFRDAHAARQSAISAAQVGAVKAQLDAAPMDLAGLNQIQAVVRGAKSMGLDAASMHEINTHARDRRRAVGSAVLAEAKDHLQTFPATLKGVQDFGRYAREISNATMGVAAEDARRAFMKVRDARFAELAMAALPEYKQDLAKLTPDRHGVQEIKKRLKGAENSRELTGDVKQAYIDATRERHDELVAEAARMREEWRQKAIAAGGDPDLVGYVFTAREAGMQIEFRDERHAVVKMFGMDFVGQYKKLQNDVVVDGPNGSILMTRMGHDLNAMGLLFQRQEE